MKAKFALFLSTASLLHAGSPDLETTIAPKPEPWIKPIIDIRARYEYADIDTFDQSNAFTVRERVGLKTQAWNGFSLLVEGEFSQAVVDHYNGGAVGADPFNPADSVIADPETNELNQGYLQYTGFDTTAKAGRQRIIYDNAAFIGNAGWRQNEQTFDAISLANTSVDKLTLNYAYVNQVNRIFGSEATVKNFEYVDANVNLFNASYTGIEGVTLGGYAYLMDFEELSAWDNNTFGISAKGTLGGILLYGEAAYQDQAGLLADDDAYYAHVTASKTFFGTHTAIIGLENLGQGFKTPLATVHAFNGFADGTDGGRISGAQNGLTDLYVGYTLPIFFGIKWMNAVRALGDNSISAGYGWEYDSVLTKKFDENFTALAKFAYFHSEDDAYVGGAAGAAIPTTTRFSVELDYTF
ncbi:MAG: hypothetical protein V4689_03585 [Verrucomicrobiota bacterium]